MSPTCVLRDLGPPRGPKRPRPFLQKRFPLPWSTLFEHPIPPPNGRQLLRLKDAAAYIMKLPKAEHSAPEWQVAMEALILVAEGGGPTMLGRIGVMRALNRGHVREFTEPRKRITGGGGSSKEFNEDPLLHRVSRPDRVRHESPNLCVSFVRRRHIVQERSKSNNDFGCSLPFANDTIEHLPHFLQIWRLSSQPV